MKLLATLFLLSVHYSHALRSIGVAESSPRRLLHNQRIARATLALQELQDLLDAPTIDFEGMDEDPPATFTKTEALRIQKTDGEEVIWRGSITDSIGFMSIYQDSNNVFSGTFSTENANYEVVQQSDGQIQIYQVRWEDQADEGDVDDQLETDAADSQASMLFKSLESDTEAVVFDPSPTVVSEVSIGTGAVAEPVNGRNLRTKRDLQQVQIDIMVVVTYEAVCGYAKQPSGCDIDSHKHAIEGRLALLIDQTDDAMQSVGTSVKMNVVRVAYINVALGPDTAALSYLRNDGYINQLRNGSGADLVAGITTPGKFCGYGNVGPCSNCHTTVTAYNCFGGYTFTHEIGHNLGALHNRGNSGSSHSYGHGHQDPPHFRSVMAYGCSGSSCPRIPKFSSPDYTYQGRSLGTSSENNARQTAEVAQSVQNYRASGGSTVNLPPPTEGSGNGGFCFSEVNTVEVQGKGMISIKYLEIGDHVRSGSSQFSQVHGFYHLERTAEADYIQIHTTNLEETLEISSNHLVFVDGTAKRAAQVQIGDNLGASIVTAIEPVKRRGIYAPATFSGDIVVSGVLTSTYSSHMPKAAINEHTGAHLVLSYHRLICRLHFDWCRNESYTLGITNLVLPVIRVAYKLGEMSGPIQAVTSLVALPFLAAVYVLEQMVANQRLLCAAVAAGYVLLLVYNKRAKRSSSKTKLT